jgi:hypothetical protein
VPRRVASSVPPTCRVVCPAVSLRLSRAAPAPSRPGLGDTGRTGPPPGGPDRRPAFNPGKQDAGGGERRRGGTDGGERARRDASVVLSVLFTIGIDYRTGCDTRLQHRLSRLTQGVSPGLGCQCAAATREPLLPLASSDSAAHWSVTTYSGSRPRPRSSVCDCDIRAAPTMIWTAMSARAAVHRASAAQAAT